MQLDSSTFPLQLLARVYFVLCMYSVIHLCLMCMRMQRTCVDSRLVLKLAERALSVSTFMMLRVLERTKPPFWPRARRFKISCSCFLLLLHAVCSYLAT